MATSDDAGNNSTAYGGGGAGGKFRKKTLRKSVRASPYDRPLTVDRGNVNPNIGNNNSGLFTRLVLDPASKLISYGANRFFASVFRKRLPPPPLQELEVNGELGDELQVSVPDVPRVEASTQKPLYNPPYDGISELEHLLKQKTFSRAEIKYLTELLKSRVIEVSPVPSPPSNEETAADIGRRQPFLSSPPEREIKEGGLSHGVVGTPISISRVTENDMASPAELAKAYMGGRPSKVSPTHNQLGREDLGLLGSAPFSSKFPVLPLTGKTSIAPNVTEDGYLTPKFRGRSAIYNMARTPYSRIHLPRDNKGTIPINNRHGRQSEPSSSHSRLEHYENFDTKPLALKRRNSVLDDDIGSVGPVRKIRPKLSLLGSRTPDSLRGVESVSDFHKASSSQLYPVTVYPNKRVSRIDEKNDNDGFQHGSYTHVPSKSSEVAAKILEHLENLTPKEKLSESKLVNAGQKSPFTSTPSMLKGQALKSIEDVGSSKMLLNVLDYPKVADRTTSSLLPIQDSIFKQQEKLKENTLKETSVTSNALNPVMKNEFVPSLKGPVPSIGTSSAAVRISLTQLPESRKTFRMSAQEDLLETVDGVSLFEQASRPSMEGKDQAETTVAGDNLSIPPKMVLHVGPCEKVSTGNGAFNKDIVNVSLSPEKANAGIQSKVLPAALSAEEERVNNSHSFHTSVSDTVDRIPSFLSKKPESSLENSSSLVDVSRSTGSKLEIAASEQGCHLSPSKIGEANGKSHTFSSTFDGPQLLKPAAISFPTAPGNEIQVSTASSGFFNSSKVSSFGSWSTNAADSHSTRVTGLGSTSTSTLVTFGGDTAGSNVAPSVFGGPFVKFGNSVDPSTTTSMASASVSGLADFKTNSVEETKLGNSHGAYPAVANLGSSPSGSDAPVSFSPGNNVKGSWSGIANEPSIARIETGLHGSTQSGSSVAFPSLSTSNAPSLSTSASNELNPSQVFGSSASASSLQVKVSSGLFGFGSTGSHGNPDGSSSGAAPAIFSFGSSSSASTSAAAPNNGNSPSVFTFGGNSEPSTLSNATRSFGSGPAGLFKFGASPPVSSFAINSLSSNGTTPSLFSFSSSSPSTGFSFGALPSTSAPANSASMIFNSSLAPPSNPVFSFTASSSPALSSSPLSINQPMFGSTVSGFTASPGINDQMNAEDTMAEDPVQSSTPIPVFGLPSISPNPPGFMFGSTVPSPPNPFQFSSQQNQVAPQNPSPFQTSGSFEFNAGGSFSLGSSGTDKSNRKFIKVSRNKNRKK